jgi:hypothetical protein
MRIGQIDVPEPLLEAQRNGTLVVFAGAGVSMPPLSDYPSFEQLAQQIAEGSTLAPEENEPLDRFLGRLQNLGVQVHQRARDLLSVPSSRPNRLHNDLLRLFDAESGIRLVTTTGTRHREVRGDAERGEEDLPLRSYHQLETSERGISRGLARNLKGEQGRCSLPLDRRVLAIAGVVVLGAIMTILGTTFVAGTIATLLRTFGVSLPTTS